MPVLTRHFILCALALILSVFLVIAWAINFPLPPRMEVWEWLAASFFVASFL